MPVRHGYFTILSCGFASRARVRGRRPAGGAGRRARPGQHRPNVEPPLPGGRSAPQTRRPEHRTMSEDRNNDGSTAAAAGAAAKPWRFRPGNPGRKPGTRNRATLAALALLEGEAVAITRKAVKLALAG